MTEADDLRDALDVVESMVHQYLRGSPQGGYEHDFMSAGERAAAVLARLRPGDWRMTPVGLELVVPGDTTPLLRRQIARATEDYTDTEIRAMADAAECAHDANLARAMCPCPCHKRTDGVT